MTLNEYTILIFVVLTVFHLYESVACVVLLICGIQEHWDKLPEVSGTLSFNARSDFGSSSVAPCSS